MGEVREEIDLSRLDRVTWFDDWLLPGAKPLDRTAEACLADRLRLLARANPTLREGNAVPAGVGVPD